MQVDGELNNVEEGDTFGVLAFGRDFVADADHLSKPAAEFLLHQYVYPLYSDNNEPLAWRHSPPHITQGALPKMLTYTEARQELAPHASQYLVSQKTDGVRAWLLMLAHPTHRDKYIMLFINRSGHVWRAPLQFAPNLSARLHDNVKMILFDGELVVGQRHLAYVVFDTIAINHTSYITMQCTFAARLRMTELLLARTGLSWHCANALVFCKPWTPLSTWAKRSFTQNLDESIPEDGIVIAHTRTPPFGKMNPETRQFPSLCVWKLKQNNTVDLWCCYDAALYTSDWMTMVYYSHDQYNAAHGLVRRKTSRQPEVVVVVATATTAAVNLATCGCGLSIGGSNSNTRYVMYNAASFYSPNNMTTNMLEWLRQNTTATHFTNSGGKFIVEFRILGTILSNSMQAHFDACPTCSKLSRADIIYLDIEPVRVRTDKSAANNARMLHDTISECLHPSLNEAQLRLLLLQ